jgi:nicotinamidase/pyrazinamidase
VKPALIIVDMVKDNVKEGSRHPITLEARTIIPNLQRVITETRKAGFPIVFACDSFFSEDFIFRGKMKVHALRGTEGSEPLDELHPEPTDIILPKRRFSAFFKTDLDMTLRMRGIDTIAVAGITVEVCVLMTAMDGLCNDFSAILLEDATASKTSDMHRSCLDLYRDFALYPLLRVMTVEQFLGEIR